MNKGTKIALSIGGIVVAGVGGYFIYKVMMKKRAKNVDLEKYTSSAPIINLDEGKTASATTIGKVAKGGSTKNPIPFTNRAEGNLFRVWVNEYFPKYALEISLDPTGSYDNKYIKRAYSQLGGLYKYSKIIGSKVADINSLIANPIAQKVKGFSSVFGTGITKVPSGTFDASKSANALYNSMKGLGTRSKQFFATMEAITPKQRLEVEDYWNTQNIGEGETLEEWIRGDFSGKSMKRALTYIEN